MSQKLNKLKKTDFPWMYDVSKCAAQEALRDLDTAFDRFFKKISAFPKKKRSKAIGSFTLTGAIYVQKDRVQLPRLGRLKLHESGYLPTDQKILSATVSEHAGHWFVSVLVEELVPEPQPATDDAVGVDVGVKDLAKCSDGRTYPNIQALRQNLKKLNRLQRQLAHCQQGSHNRQKIKAKLARLHYRMTSLRIDISHQATSDIVAKTKPNVERPSTVVIEELNVKGMLKNHKLAIADVGFGRFRQFLDYKTAWAGEVLLKADRFYPSPQTCSQCGRPLKVNLELSDRTFVCDQDDCDFTLDRDLNAALNLRNLAYQPTASSAESNACRANVRPNVLSSTEGHLLEAGTKYQKRSLSDLGKL